MFIKSLRYKYEQCLPIASCKYFPVDMYLTHTNVYPYIQE